MNIRQATVKDLEGMQNVNLTNLPENYGFRYYLYHALAWPGVSYVATVPDSHGRDRIVGYVLAKMNDDDPSAPPGKLSGHVTSLSVMRSYRRLGLAARLMRQSLAGLAENYAARQVTLHVRKSNRAAFHLYKDTLRFEIVKVETSYYADGEDAYYMSKQLDEYADDELDSDSDLLTDGLHVSALRLGGG